MSCPTDINCHSPDSS